MNKPSKRLLVRLQAAVAAQRALHEALDDLRDQLTGNSLNEQQQEELEEFVEGMALSVDDRFEPAEAEMTHVFVLLRILEGCQP
jgi:hypothetical protein